MSAITVVNESTLACDEGAIISLLTHHMPRTGIDPMSPIDVLIVDEERMAQLHLQWMDEPGATDVLSFPMDELRGAVDGEPPQFGMLGDIVVCAPVAARQAGEQGRSTEEEIAFLITHGFLHLIGFDHASESDQAEMFALQDELLRDWTAARSVNQ
jgi:probable rRNA maturation factor